MERICPVCHIPLVEISMESELVDKCPQCKGIYFDCGELERIATLVKKFFYVRSTEEEVNTIDEEEHKRKMLCPADQTVMEKFDIAGTVIDKCPECNGIWLDDNEVIALKLAYDHIHANLALYKHLATNE